MDLRQYAKKFKGQNAQSMRSQHDEAAVFLSKVRGCIDKGESKQLKEITTNSDYKGLVKYTAWDLLPIIGPHLSNKEKNDDMYNNCVEIVVTLAELGNPKEMFIGLLEQVDRFLDSLVHSDLLGPLQTVIKRIGLTKPLYFNQLLTTLYAHMETLKLPSVNGMGAMEKRLMSQDPDFSKVETTTVALLEFLAPLVHDVKESLVTNTTQQSYTLKDIQEIEGTRIEMMKFVLNLMDHPLIAIELKYLNDSEEEANELEELGVLNEDTRRRITRRNDDDCISKTSAEQCMFYLDSMGCSFTNLLIYASQHNVNLDTLSEQRKRRERRNEEDGNDDDLLPVLGLGCFTYMILVMGYQTNRMPSVYSAVYMMKVSMPYIEAMLRRPEEPIITKGLELLSSLVDRLDVLSLHASLIETKANYLQIPECMVQIMVYCPSKPIRRMSVSLLPRYIDSFDWKGRYHLLRSLLLNTSHSGVRGLLIGKVKDYVHATLQNVSDTRWFIGSHAHHLYAMIFKLDKGVKTDLLNSSDKEIGSLNFLRYLLLRDSPDENLTGIWPQIESIQTNYLRPLHNCLTMSKDHYVSDLKAKQKEIRLAARDKTSLTGKLTVGGFDYPKMPLTEQVKVLESSQYTLDLLASILNRIGEIIPAKNVTQKGSTGDD